MARIPRSANPDLTIDRATQGHHRKHSRNQYLQTLETVKKERAPLSGNYVDYPEATNPDVLNSFSRFHVQGVALGSLVNELMNGNHDKPFHRRISQKRYRSISQTFSSCNEERL